MGEVLLSGPPERPPRRWPRLAMVAAVLLAVGAFGVPRLFGGGSPGPTPAPSANPTSSSPQPTAPPATADSSPRPRLDGVQAALPPGLVLVLGGPRPTVIGSGGGPAFQLDRVPIDGDAAVASVLPAPGGLLVLVQRGLLSPTEPADKAYLVNESSPPLLLTEADEVVIGHRHDRIFAFRFPPYGQHSGTLLEVSWSGRVLARHATPPGFDLIADTSAGLLATIRPDADGPFDLRIVNARTLALVRHVASVAYVVAATNTWAAWVGASCETDCVLTVAGLPAGARRSLRLGPEFIPAGVAISPDGRRIAVGSWGHHAIQPDAPAVPGVVEVIDLATGTTTRVPGVATGVKRSADLAWTPDGSALALTVPFPDTDVRLAGIWPLSGGPVHLLPRTFTGAYPPSVLVALPSVSRPAR